MDDEIITSALQHNVAEKDFKQMLLYRKLLIENSKRLGQLDPNDNYWEDLTKENARGLVNCNMVSLWIGDTKHPRRILEIGTRTGGSLIALLCLYKKDNFEKIEEIVSFDIWREYWNTTPLYSFLAKIFKKDKWSITVMQRFGKLFGNYVIRTATQKVKRNLKFFNIPSNKIVFISGNSKITVPEYFAKHPHKKYDYILVDGGHDELTAETDLNNIADHVASQGIILFDDISGSYQLITVWNRFKERHSDKFNFFEILYGQGVAFAVKK